MREGGLGFPLIAFETNLGAGGTQGPSARDGSAEMKERQKRRATREVRAALLSICRSELLCEEEVVERLLTSHRIEDLGCPQAAEWHRIGARKEWRYPQRSCSFPPICEVRKAHRNAGNVLATGYRANRSGRPSDPCHRLFFRRLLFRGRFLHGLFLHQLFPKELFLRRLLLCGLPLCCFLLRLLGHITTYQCSVDIYI